MRKRSRSGSTATEISSPKPPAARVATLSSDALADDSLEAVISILQQPKRRLPLVSFTLAPPVPLPIWQRVALSAVSHAQYHTQESSAGFSKRRRLVKELTRYHADVRAREERVRREQREARAKLGMKLASSTARFWTKRGDAFQQLARVEFDVVKHYSDKRRQEDLLAETEAITKKLLDRILTDKGTSTAAVAPSPSSASPSTAVARREHFRGSDGDGSVEVESFLSLLDTQGGTRPLRHYQRSALYWMVHLYESNLNGILADEMGLGKTVQTIALLCYFAEYHNDWGPHLIVVPTTVVLNWAAELRRWAPGLKVLTYVGTVKERHKLRKGWMSEDAFHVCVTSYNLVVQDRQVFRRRPWGFLVLDEAHQVKNFLSRKWQSLFDLQAQYRLLLTGTPLQNSIMELWSLFHFLLPSASAFRSNDEFKEWFSNPMDDMITGRASLNEDIVRRLQTLLRPFMLRRLKKDVESQLPSKTERVVLCHLSRRQRGIYDDYMQMASTRQRLLSGGPGGVMSVLLALRKVCDHPNLFEERPTVSPFVLDRLGSITLSVPRAVLLRRNCYRGRYVFARLSVCDLNDDAGTSRRPEPTSDDEGGALVDWLPCSLLRVRFTYLPFLQSGGAGDALRDSFNARFAPLHFSSPPEKHESESRLASTFATARTEGEEEGSDCSLSAGFVHLLHSSISAADSAQLEARARTRRFQQQRHCEVCAGVNQYYPCACTLVLKDAIVKGHGDGTLLNQLCPNVATRAEAALPLIKRVATYVPPVLAVHPPSLHCSLPVTHMSPFVAPDRARCAPLIGLVSRQCLALADGRGPRQTRYNGAFFLSELWPVHVRRCFSFPDKRLLIHDCGKLQFLATALPRMRQEGHRALIFTQFVQMLNLLEQFLALIGVAYMRLDGSTHVEQRQVLVDRFNIDTRVTCMILSTRSGGIGLNLTGADTVIFYDSDWNPTMDLQAQDRCHRIGQTRPVTIYRLISEHTVEESILQKARERKKLNNVVIRGGQFHAIAGVADEYEDTAAAFAALSDPVNLRSFFHDLDEDATVSAASSPASTTVDAKTPTAEELLAEMRRAEDAEDREAQEQLEMELRQRAEDENADQLGDDEASGAVGAAVGCSVALAATANGNATVDLAHYFCGDERESVDGVDAKLLPLIRKRQREVLGKMHSPLDRLLSVRYGVCHEADARERYEYLHDSYEAQLGNEVKELPPFRSQTPLL